MKKITRRSFLAVCGTVAAAAALTACGGSASSASTTASSVASAASSTAEKAAGTLSGNVATGGSTSMKNVIAALTEGFAEVEPGVTVSYDPTGSGAGITGATDKTLDIGLSSRALKDDEKNDVDGTTVALDGIAIIVNKDSKVADLTVEQLKQMFTGEITNWSEVGGDDGEIVLIGREAGSGTRDGFESIVPTLWPSATLPCPLWATPWPWSPWKAWSAARLPSRTAATRSSVPSCSSPTRAWLCRSRPRPLWTLPPARTPQT